MVLIPVPAPMELWTPPIDLMRIVQHGLTEIKKMRFLDEMIETDLDKTVST